jgi:hypothetical protein
MSGNMNLVDLLICFFVSFFNYFLKFTSFNIELIKNWVSYFVSICFLWGILIPWSGFDRLTWVDSTRLVFLVEFYFKLYPITLDWLSVGFNIYFFLSIRLYGSYYLGDRYDKSTQIDPIWSNILSFKILKKKMLYLSRTIFLSVVRVFF